MKMGINTEKSVGNLKSIIEKNRQLMTFLEEQNAVIIWNHYYTAKDKT